MFRTEMLDYFKNKMKEIDKNYILALKKNDPDGIHDLRVALKRLKAFFRLIETINCDFDAAGNFKNFKKIAKNTSSLRDSQVQQIVLNETKEALGIDVNEFELFLRKIETESVEKFQTFSKKAPVKKLKASKKNINNALKNISPVLAETKVHGRFYNQRNNLIIMSRKKYLKEELLHTLRFLSKETHYTFEIAQQCFKMFEDNEDFVRAIKKVHQTLGNWHDYYVSLEYLNNFMSVRNRNLSSEPYMLLKKHLIDVKNNYKSDFRSVFNEFAKNTVLS